MKPFYYILVLFIILFSCSENSNQPTDDNNSLSKLIINNWLLDKSIIDGDTTYVYKRIKYTFTSKKVYLLDLSGNQYEGEWTINEKDSTLLFLTGLGNSTIKILELNKTNLVWQYDFKSSHYVEFFHKLTI